MAHELVARLLSELAAARATIAASYDKLWPAGTTPAEAMSRDETAPGHEPHPPTRAEEPDAG
jgi:hypothetical protein